MLLAMFLHGCVMALCAAAALYDLRCMRIPNWISLALVGLFAFGAAAGNFSAPSLHLYAFAVTFLLMAGLFFAGLMGGGDAKLIAALSLWVGLKGLIPFLLVTTVCGGLLALAAMALIKSRALETVKLPGRRYFCAKESWLYRLTQGERVVPYGVAIAAGAVIALSGGF